MLFCSPAGQTGVVSSTINAVMAGKTPNGKVGILSFNGLPLWKEKFDAIINMFGNLPPILENLDKWNYQGVEGLSVESLLEGKSRNSGAHEVNNSPASNLLFSMMVIPHVHWSQRRANAYWLNSVMMEPYSKRFQLTKAKKGGLCIGWKLIWCQCCIGLH